MPPAPVKLMPNDMGLAPIVSSGWCGDVGYIEGRTGDVGFGLASDFEPDALFCLIGRAEAVMVGSSTR